MIWNRKPTMTAKEKKLVRLLEKSRVTSKDLVRLCGVTGREVQYFQTSGVISEKADTFNDVVLMHLIKQLKEIGVSNQHIVSYVKAISKTCEILYSKYEDIYTKLTPLKLVTQAYILDGTHIHLSSKNGADPTCVSIETGETSKRSLHELLDNAKCDIAISVEAMYDKVLEDTVLHKEALM